MTQTIQCIGRCAARLSNVTESCLTGLIALMHHKDGVWNIIEVEMRRLMPRCPLFFALQRPLWLRA